MNYPSLLKEILECGETFKPHGKEIRELMGVDFEVSHDKVIYGFGNVRPAEKIINYWKRELAWYMSGNRLPSYVAKVAGLWDKIKNHDGTINSNYGHLVFYSKTIGPSGYNTQTPFEWAVNKICEDIDTRQALMTYNTGGFNYEGNGDYICTQHQAFYVRNGRLDCYIALRSSDVIFGLQYNMLWWSFVHQCLLLSVNKKHPEIKLGKISVKIYSAHIYAAHYDLVGEILKRTPDTLGMTVNDVPKLGESEDFYECYFEKFISLYKTGESTMNMDKQTEMEEASNWVIVSGGAKWAKDWLDSLDK